MEFFKKNKKYFYIYFVLIFSFTAFYLILFIVNRLQYINSSLNLEQEKLMEYIDTIADKSLITNRYQLLYFIDYVGLLDFLYKNNKKSLQHFLNINNMYSSIYIVNHNGKPIYKKLGNLDFAIDVRLLLYGDSLKTTIAFDDRYSDIYRIFILKMNSLKDAYVVAYLNIDVLYSIANTYIVSKDGRLLSSYKEESGFDNFSSQYPIEWKKIINDKDGQYVSNNGIFTYKSFDTVGSINNIDVEQESAYIISIKTIDPNDNPYSINSISSFIKYADFNINIIYWIIGYIWIVFTSIVVLLIIINKYKNIPQISLDEKLGIVDRVIGYSKIKNIIYYINLNGISKILYIVITILCWKKPVNSVYFCKICINGLKRISINLDHKHKDEIMQKTINIIKVGLNKDSILIRISLDEFLIVFINSKIEYINNYYTSISKVFASKNLYNDYKHKFLLSHGIVKYEKYSNIDDCINNVSKLEYKDKLDNDVNLFFN